MLLQMRFLNLVVLNICLLASVKRPELARQKITWQVWLYCHRKCMVHLLGKSLSRWGGCKHVIFLFIFFNAEVK